MSNILTSPVANVPPAVTINVEVLDVSDSLRAGLLVEALLHGGVMHEHHGEQVRQRGGLLDGVPGAPLRPGDDPGTWT